jgi:hypothetical protein
MSDDNLLTSSVPRTLDTKSKILGLELTDVLLLLLNLSIQNLIFGSTSMKIPMVFGTSLVMAGLLFFVKRGKPDLYLQHLMQFKYELIFSFVVSDQAKEIRSLEQKRRMAHSLAHSQSNRVSDLESESRLSQTTDLLREIIETGQKIFQAELMLILREPNTRDGQKRLNLNTKEVLSHGAIPLGICRTPKSALQEICLQKFFQYLLSFSADENSFLNFSNPSLFFGQTSSANFKASLK